MKIACTCNHLIIDQTDYLKNKGYIISDTQWFDFWEAIEAAIQKPQGSSDSESMQLRMQHVFKTAWECMHCGKLYVEGKGGTLIAYTPDSSKYNSILTQP